MDFSRCCAVVGSASFDAGHFLAEYAQGRFSCVVAVDGGYASLREAGVSPDVALGDFDSLGYVPEASQVVRHPAMKDDSDLMLSLRWACDRGFSSAVAYGALGGRLDHTLATQQALVHFARKGMDMAAVGEGCLIVPLSSRGRRALELPSRMEGIVSVFAVGDEARGVREEGLMWELDGATLENGTPLGLSNEFTGRASRISVAEGDVLVFLPSSPLGVLA